MPEAFTPELSPVAVVAVEPPRQRALDDGVRAPGWFDSSWELQRGLEVKEAWFGEDGLNGWIESFLLGQRASGRMASPSASTAIA